MASEGKNGRDDRRARGWDLFKWNWIAEPPEWFTATVYGLLFIIFLLVAASGIVALWQLLAPIWTGASPAPSSTGTEPGAELRGRLLIIGALLTTPFLIWRLIVGHWAARAAQEQARTAQETARNTLFTKAIEQLGATREEKTKRSATDANGATTSTEESAIRPNIEVRLGAIYALEKLARDDLEMHWPIMETLCAYIRENAGPPKPPPTALVAILTKPDRHNLEKGDPVAESDALDELERECDHPSVDVQAAVTVIGRRGAKQIEYERARREDETGRIDPAWQLDLSNCHLALASFSRLDFTAARFDGSSLYLSNFAGTALTGAAFREAHLEGANFIKAHLESANFVKTRLEGAWCDAAHLERAVLSDARLQNAWLRDAHLERALLHDAYLEGAYLGGAHLEDATLTKAHLKGAWLDNAHLEITRLNEANFEGAHLRAAHLEGASLLSAHFEGAHLQGAHLDGALLGEAHLQGALLDRVRLNGASLHEAHLEGASLGAAVLVDALLDGADLVKAENVDQTQLDAAWGNKDTVLPDICARPLNERWLPEKFGWEELDDRWKRWNARHEFWRAEAKNGRKAEAAPTASGAAEQ